MNYNEMKIGDKLEQGYMLLADGKWDGAFYFMSAMADLYMLDAIDEEIYEKLAGYVAVLDMDKADTEANQWVKSLLLDARYAKLILAPGDLLENLRACLNQLPVIRGNMLTESFLDGNITKLKYLDGAFYYIQHDYEKNMHFLIRATEEGIAPLDFDVKDFQINRAENRIEFTYTRGYKQTMSVKPDGSDKKILDEKKEDKEKQEEEKTAQEASEE